MPAKKSKKELFCINFLKASRLSFTDSQVENMSYNNKIKKISGKKIGDIFIFALSTCIWCQKTKNLFKELGVEYSYVDVDLLEGEDQEQAVADMAKWSKNQSFPLIVLNKKKTILGFKEAEIRDFCGK